MYYVFMFVIGFIVGLVLTAIGLEPSDVLWWLIVIPIAIISSVYYRLFQNSGID